MASLSIGPVHPGNDRVVISAPVILIGAVIRGIRSKLLDDDGIPRRHADPHVGIPAAGVHFVGRVGIKMGGVNDPVAGPGVRQVIGRDSCQVIGPAYPAGNDHIIGAGVSNGRQKGLHPNAVETGTARRSAVFPGRPACSERFVKEVKNYRGVIGKGGSHR